MGLGGGFGEEIQKEEARLFSLPAGRLKEAAQDAVIFQSLVRAGAVDDFAHDGHQTQTTTNQWSMAGSHQPSEKAEALFLTHNSC